jgi:hypothetical protein
MHMRDTFRNVHGILTGTPTYVLREDKARTDDLFGN